MVNDIIRQPVLYIKMFEIKIRVEVLRRGGNPLHANNEEEQPFHVIFFIECTNSLVVSSNRDQLTTNPLFYFDSKQLNDPFFGVKRLIMVVFATFRKICEIERGIESNGRQLC
jgi:hypothetical protein